MIKKLFLIGLGLLFITNAYALNLSRVKTWSAEILTHTDLNAEFDNIINHSITSSDISASAAIPGSKLDLSVPGIIGGTTPAAGTFSTLSATGNTTLGNGADSITFNSSSGITYTPAATWTFTGAQTVSGTWTDLGTVTTVDVNGGTVDGATIGGSSAGAGTFTTLSSTGATTIGDAAADTLLVNANTIEFEGATANGYENVFSMPDPTAADNTFTFPQLSGTVVLTTGAGANIDIGAYDLRAATITPDGLTSGRVTFATTNGTLTDDADMAFATDTLTITKIAGVTSLVAGADIDIGSYELRAQTLESDVATGTAPFTIASTTKSTNLNADLLDGANTATSATASVIYIAGADTYLPDATVDTTALKTATGEVSATTADFNFLTLPGGEYGFYPQIKVATAVNGIGATIGGVSGNGTGPLNTSYATIITVYCNAGAGTAYAQQRYITASGLDHWIFLLIDKVTNEILAAYQAPDAPHYGNSGDYNKVPHPFESYNPDTQEIVLVDKETANLIKSQATNERSILTIVNEDMKIDYATEKVYEPLHSGKYLKVDKDGKQMQVKEMVTEIAPYIKVKGLKPYVAEEKIQREKIRKQKELEDRQKTQEDKNKLEILRTKLNLTKEEFELLKTNVK